MARLSDQDRLLLSEADGWPQFCEILSRYSGDGRTSLRDLEKIATRKGLSLPRSTLSRHLQGDKLPRRLVVQNYLLALEMDPSDSGEVLKAWDRIADLKVHAERQQGSGGEYADQATDEMLYDFARDLLDVVRAAMKRLVVEAKDEIDLYSSQARDQQKEAHQEAQDLLGKARGHLDSSRKDGEKFVANAKREAAQIISEAKLEAQSMVANSVLRVPLDSISPGSTSGSLTVPGLKLSGSVLDSASAQSSALKIDLNSPVPSTGEQQKSASQKKPGGSAQKNSSEESESGSAQQQVPNAELHLEVGDRVAHDKYGLGTVIEKTGEGSKATVRIDFGSVGVVKLMLIGGVPLRKV